MRALFIIAVALSLYGCGGPTVFAKQGAGQVEFSQDKYDCEVLLGYRGHAGRTQPTDQLADFIVRGKAEMQACLERKGWQVVQR